MLESQRGFLFIAFAALSFFLYSTWQAEQEQPRAAKPVVSTEVGSVIDNPIVDVPAQADVALTASSTGDLPTVDTAVMAQPVTETVLAGKDRYVSLQNSKLRVVIDRVGGDVVEADLLSYSQSLENSAPVRLLFNSNNRLYVARTGIAGVGGPDASDKRASYQIVEQMESSVTLQWRSADGLLVNKRFQLTPDSHKIDVSYKLVNDGTQIFNGQLWGDFKRDQVMPATNMATMGTFTGAAFGTEEKRYNKLTFEEIAEQPMEAVTNGGWVAMMQHYFLSAWVPASETGNKLSTRVTADQNVIIGFKQPAFSLMAGETLEQRASLYIGPKLQSDLEKIAHGLDLTVDYGFLWWIGQPLFGLLSFLHSLFANWGVAIILVTVLVKAALYPLSNAQYRSFAKMRKLQPKMEQLKERYGDDRTAFGQAMMEMYKKEKVNPLGGCFPLLLQMPVFFALYWVLSESVEMRQAPFFGWIHDLSVMDPYYVLPVLMGISMWFMQKLQPMSPTMDPMQQKIMQYMPVLMTVFFVWAPSGLVLYWFVNNLLSIAQQQYITKRIEADDNRKK